MKKILSLCLSVLVLLALFVPASAEGNPLYNIIPDAQGIYLFNPETGTALYEKEADSRMFPASTTKIMTALVVLESCPDPKNTTITVTDTAMFSYIIEDGGVHMNLARGEVFTVYDLLLGLMMNSYCDVSDLLAYHFGEGSVDAFVEKMNDKAESMGLKNTHFTNAHGLHDPDHYSSPRDIALILEEAVKIPLFREIISTRSYTIPATQQRGARSLRYTVSSYYDNHKYYLDSYVGGKSGFTDQAGRCLATLSEKDGVSFIAVLLGANKDPSQNYTDSNTTYRDTFDLLYRAHENFEIRTILKEGDEIEKLPVDRTDANVSVVIKEDVNVLVSKGEEADWRAELPESLTVEKVEDGAEVGKVILRFGDTDLEKTYSLVLSWDGTPLEEKTELQQDAEEVWHSVTGIFETDRVFVTLLICLLVLIAICIPAMKITKLLHKKKSHLPKH